MGNAQSNNWATNFKKLKEIHDNAYKTIEEAIKLEEDERPIDAVNKYKQGISIIDKALGVTVSSPDKPDESWHEATAMVKKMKKTRAEVSMRINSITSSPDFEFVDVSSEMLEETSQGTNEDLIICQQLAKAISNLTGVTPKGEAALIYIQNNVQLYFIAPDGEVRSTLEPQTLRILQFDDVSCAVRTFLQIGNWYYPLVEGVSPCLCTDFDAFILPDIYSDVEGASVGIILPEGAKDDFFSLLKDILQVAEEGIVQAKEPTTLEEEQRSTPSARIASGLITGAGFISKGLIFGAQKVGDLIAYSTPKLISNLKPAQTTAKVPETVCKSVDYAQRTTSKAAQVTGVVAEKICFATTKFGQFLAPHIKTQGAKLLTNFDYSEREANERMDGFLNVAAGAAEGFATIYTGLDTSAGILLNSLRENSVKVVQHTHGESASLVVDKSFGTVENVMTIRNKAKIITPKGLAKNTAKQTTLAFVNSSAASTSLSGPLVSSAHQDDSCEKKENLDSAEKQ